MLQGVAFHSVDINVLIRTKSFSWWSFCSLSFCDVLHWISHLNSLGTSISRWLLILFPYASGNPVLYIWSLSLRFSCPSFLQATPFDWTKKTLFWLSHLQPLPDPWKASNISSFFASEEWWLRMQKASPGSINKAMPAFVL